MVSTITTNSSVGPSSGSVIAQNRRVPVAPSMAAASWRSSGMLCSPAVTRMNVNPRLPHTFDTATDQTAVPGSRSRPGLLTTGNRSPSQPMLDSTPTSGWSRNSHIRLLTATDVATVDEKIVRNVPIPRSVLSASTASPTPSTSPRGTVISANWTVTHSAFWNSDDRNTSMYWPHPYDTQLAPWLSHR